MLTKTGTIIFIILILATACSQTDSPPTVSPTETSPVTATSTELSTSVPTDSPAMPEPETVETYTAQVTSYNLGDSMIIQDHFPEDSRFREMPVRLEGVIGLPESDEAHPVVLILHGSHHICGEDIWPCAEDVEQKNYEGFTYLVEALAEAGYVALSINVNAEHTFAHGEAPPSIRTMQLIDMHLEELVAANTGESDKFGVDVNGRADLSRMVWMGHSRGGDFVNWIVREQNLVESASPIRYGPVNGVLFIAPPLVFLDTLPTVDLPFSTILSACDGDVNLLDGQGYYESARFVPERSHSGASVYLEGANHNNFNTTLDPERSPEDRPDCTAETSLSAAQQQEFLVQYTRDFLQTVYGQPEQAHAAKQRLGLAEDTELPTSFYDYAVRFNTLPASTDWLPLFQPQSEAELSQNLLGGEVTLTGLDVLFCPEGYYVPEMEPGTEPCKRVNLNQPGYPQQFVVSWEAPDAEWRMTIPESEGDLTDYTAVQLRAALDPLSELNVAGEPQAFTVELVDASGTRAQTIISPIDFPVGEEQPNDFFEGGFFSGHVHMSSLRIPLAEFSGIDLASVTEIALIFDQTPSGTLFVADLAFVKPEIEE